MDKFIFSTVCNIKPIPKARARVSRRGWAYTPKTTKEFEQSLKEHVQSHYKGGVLTEDLYVDYVFLFPRPKTSKYKKPRKGDFDNYMKAVNDALNGVLWSDDVIIQRVSGYKDFCDDDIGFVNLCVFRL